MCHLRRSPDGPPPRCDHLAVDSSIFLPLGTLVLGSVLTFVFETLRHRRMRSEAVQDARRSERSQAYVDFLNSAHEAAHLLGRATPGCPHPIEPDVAYWKLDSDVTRRLRVIEILGSDGVIAAARGVRESLGQFREMTMRDGVTYESDEYLASHRIFAGRREALIVTARADLRDIA